MLIDPKHLAQLLATADPRAPVTLSATAPADVWRRLLGMQTSAPENLSTRQCAATFGWSEAQWRRWASGIEGAVRDGKAWRIPREAAKMWADRKMGRAAGGASTPLPKRRSGNYGKPWSRKKHAPAAAAAAAAPAEGTGPAVVPIAGRVHRS